MGVGIWFGPTRGGFDSDLMRRAGPRAGGGLLLRSLRNFTRLNRGASGRVWVLSDNIIIIILKLVVRIPLKFAKMKFHPAVDFRITVLIYLIGMYRYRPQVHTGVAQIRMSKRERKTNQYLS